MTPKKVVYLRIPVERNGFVDPPSVNWSEAKEEKLWAVLSNSKKTDVNWPALSSQFGVPTKFLQQQAYWLYEKELEQLRSRIQQDASLSSATITDQGHSQYTLKKSTSRHVNIFDSSSKTPQPSHLEPVQEPDHEQPRASVHQNFHYVEDAQDQSSDLGSSSSSDDDTSGGSMLLQRSRILAKAPPRFKDIDEDIDEDEDEDAPGSYIPRELKVPHSHGIAHARTTTVDSSLSNLSSADSISKSALEEALLHNDHFS